MVGDILPSLMLLADSAILSKQAGARASACQVYFNLLCLQILS
jgi:hypothetical protein